MAPPSKPQQKKAKKGLWLLYNSSGTLERKNKFCPKCGKGFFLAQHKDRLACGQCKYTEFVKK
ncbi:30S ribosomal protein S27ae [Candidatus Woesearchaeota archaeon]|nr:30S ribosomal protein S27ae [Candidatus Woesearchaeota archaeon]